MIGIFSTNYEQIAPLAPKYKALTVFDLQAAKYAFINFPALEFVFLINEETNTYAKCFNYAECVQFLKPDDK